MIRRPAHPLLFLLTFTACGVEAPPERQKPAGPAIAPAAEAPAAPTTSAGTTETANPPQAEASEPSPTTPSEQGTESGCNTTGLTRTLCPDAGFTPDSSAEGFERWTTNWVTIPQGGPRHRGVDTIVNPGQAQVLSAKFAYGAVTDADLVGEKVEVWVQTGCASWRKLGTTWTSDDGDLPTYQDIEDDGGRILFTIPPTDSLPVGDWRIKLLVKGDHSEANLWLHVWPRGTQVVVSDIDGTLTTEETDGLVTAFDPLAPDPQLGGAELFQAYYAKALRPIYLTARPEFQTNGTRAWFKENGFPEGVLKLSQSNLGVQGNAASEYKRNYVRLLRDTLGLTLFHAHGNKSSDLLAYLDAGVTAANITLISGEYDGDLFGATKVDDYVARAAEIACMAPVSQP